MLSCHPQSSSWRFFTIFEQYASLNSRIRSPHRFPQCKHQPQPTYQRQISTSPASENAPTPTNHYNLFPLTLPAGPPPAGSFAVNLSGLKKEFLQLQSRAHPDLHHGTSKSRAEGLSALINDAYKTLQHPLLRAQYILSLRGIEIADDEGTRGGDHADQGILMEVLEVREAIEEAETEEDVRALEAENAGKIRGCAERLEGFFARDDLQGARKEVGRLRYWCAIEEALRGWEKGKRVVLEH